VSVAIAAAIIPKMGMNIIFRITLMAAAA